MNLFKKKDPIEKLSKKCANEYRDFVLHLSQAHYLSYAQFKLQLKNDFDYLRDEIYSSNNDKITLALLNHFKLQLNFINEHCFSASEDVLKTFINNNYPYVEKIQDVIKSNTLEHPKFNF